MDNNTIKMNASAKSNSSLLFGGDGGFTFFGNSTDTNKILGSVQGGNFRKYNATSVANGTSYAGDAIGTIGLGFKGDFISYADYDKQNDVLYSIPIDSNVFIRRKNVFGTVIEEKIQSTDLQGSSTLGLNNSKITCITISPNDPTTLYLGTNNGRVVRIKHANTCNAVITLGDVKYMNTNLLPLGVISNITIKKSSTNTDDEIIAVYSSYGVTNRIWRTTNGTAPTVTWANITGNYGDLPIWWASFAPTNTMGVKLLLGTELGVWTTDNYNTYDRFKTGMPNARVTMLKTNEADNSIIASTFGRGMYRTDAFSNVKVGFNCNQTIWGGPCCGPITFTSTSIGATSYAWDLKNDGIPDGGNTNSITTTDPGEYVRLTINGNYSIVQKVSDLVGPFPNGLSCAPCPPAQKSSQNYNVKIYPNPVNSTLHISSDKNIDMFTLFDLSGRQISTLQNFDYKDIDMQNLSTGVYIYKYTINGEVYNGKVVKE